MVQGPAPNQSRGLRHLVTGLLWIALSTGQAGAQPNDNSDADRDAEYKALAAQIVSLERQSNLLKQVVKIVRPSVVHIEVRKSGASRRNQEQPDETGSGVIFRYNDKFYVLTNRHLIRAAQLAGVTITLADGREIAPNKKWEDAGTDIAVMSVAGTRLRAARVGDSDKLEIGDFVLAIGSPFGLSHSVTFGIISAKGRRDLELAADGISYQDFMQIDASINPGNSGGPLVNLRGEVIGINTAIASTSGRNEGVGFTIPGNMAMIVARQLIERGVVRRGFLGVNLDARFGAVAAAKLGLDRPRGARVTSVTNESPADKAGLKVGDVILQFNTTQIESDSHLVNTVSLTQVGKEVPMRVFRDGKSVELKVTVGNRADFRR
jgi:serine protease Do